MAICWRSIAAAPFPPTQTDRIYHRFCSFFELDKVGSLDGYIQSFKSKILLPHNCAQLKKAFAHYLSIQSFMSEAKQESFSYVAPDMFVILAENNHDSPINQYEYYTSMLWKLQNQVLSMSRPSFSRIVSERDWLNNFVKIWELVKNSVIIVEYNETLQSSGLFRR